MTAPAATNPNLRAQRGLFTLVEERPGKNARLPLDEALGKDGLGYIDLRRFSLPTSEAPHLLRLLAVEGVTAARLFPGYGGVVESMFDERLWD